MPNLTSASLPLSGREEMVARLFTDGHTAEETGLTMGLSPETVRSYLADVRMKYRNAGRDASDKVKLRTCLSSDGVLSE